MHRGELTGGRVASERNWPLQRDMSMPLGTPVGVPRESQAN